jgi:hypothetical protein
MVKPPKLVSETKLERPGLQSLAPARVPAAPGTVLKLDIGCGLNPHEAGDPSWTHFDAVSNPCVNLVGEWDAIDLPTESVQELWLGDVLEHIPLWRIAAILAEWNRILRPGGIVRGTTPNLDYVIHAAVSGERHEGWTNYDWLMASLYGWRTGRYEQHYQTFTREHLIETLGFMGLDQIDLSGSPGPANRPWWWVFKGVKVRACVWREYPDAAE